MLIARADALMCLTPACRPFSMRRLGCNAELIVDEFGEKLLEELDYQQEARNIQVSVFFGLCSSSCASMSGRKTAFPVCICPGSALL